MRKLLALPLAALVGACGGDASAGSATSLPAVPRQLIVALDLSGSQSEAKRADAQRVLAAIIDDLDYGDQIVLLQVHQRSAAEDEAVRWHDTVPRPRHGQPTTLDRERLEAVQSAARRVAARIFANERAGRIATTDLFSTLHVAGEFMRDADGRRTSVVLLSDMLQSANGIDMERASGVPAASWLARQKEAGLVPALPNACVAVVGADATSQQGVAVKRFWREYLSAAGAELRDENYRLMSTASPISGCG